MFEAASHNIVQACGDDCLRNVPSVFESDDFKLLKIVVRKRRRFFFLPSKYTSTPFTLQDLLLGDNADFKPTEESNVLIKDYQKDYKLSLKGHAGSKIKAMFEVELEGKDDIDVECDLGDLQKDSLKIPDFIKSLVGRKMNLDHDFVRQVRQDKRKSLCVVVGTVSLTRDCCVETKLDAEGSEKISADKGGTVSLTRDCCVEIRLDAEGSEKISADKLKIATIDESSSISSNKDRKLTLLKGTVLGYQPYELSVRPTGTIEVILDEDVKGGFVQDQVDGTRVPTPPPDDGISDLFSPIITADRSQRVLVRRAVLDLCLHPQAFQRFCNILAEARRCMKKQERLYTTVGKLKGQVDVNFDSWLELLKFADFKIEGGKVTYPSIVSADFEAVYTLLKCLRVDGDDTLLTTLSQVSNQQAPSLAALLLSATRNEELPVTAPSVKAVFDTDNPARTLLLHLGFSLASSLVLPADKVKVKAVYQVVYSLFDCKR